MASKRRRQRGEGSLWLEDESPQQSSIREFFSKKPKASKTPRRPTAVASATPSKSSSSSANRATTITPSSVAKLPSSSSPFPAATNATQPSAGNNDNTLSPPPPQQQQQQPKQKPPPKKKHKFQQLYLDLGQRNFGKQTVCSICGMLFVHGLAEDAKEHERICKEFREGVAFQLDTTKACRVVREFGKHGCNSSSSSSSKGNSFRQQHKYQGPQLSVGGSTILLPPPKTNALTAQDTEAGCIVEIRPTDTYALRQKVVAAMAIVDKELGFVQAESSSTRSTNKSGRPASTVFLYIRQKRIVGMVSAEITRQAYRLLLVNNNNSNEKDKDKDYPEQQKPTPQHHHQPQQYERSTQPQRAMIGIHKLWVHSKIRHQSLATRMVDTARSRMVFGSLVPAHLVAFSSPTEAGTRFAQAYVHDATGSTDTPVLVYDLPL